MPHKHPGNEGDYLKHVILEELIEQCCRLAGAQHIRYIDPNAGEGIFELKQGARHQPVTPSSKVVLWRNQQYDPNHYFGSPIIALRVLFGCGREYSLRLCDSHAGTVEHLRSAVQARVPVSADIQTNVVRFTGPGIAQWLDKRRHAVNIVLLDPTNQPGYVTTIQDSLNVCRESNCNAIVMCWGLQSWRWPEWGGVRRAEAKYSHGKFPSVVHLLSVDPADLGLTDVIGRVVQDW